MDVWASRGRSNSDVDSLIVLELREQSNIGMLNMPKRMELVLEKNKLERIKAANDSRKSENGFIRKGLVLFREGLSAVGENVLGSQYLTIKFYMNRECKGYSSNYEYDVNNSNKNTVVLVAASNNKNSDFEKIILSKHHSALKVKFLGDDTFDYDLISGKLDKLFNFGNA